MYPALNPAAMGIRVRDLQDAIRLARETGYSGVEVDAEEVSDLVERLGEEAVAGLFSRAGILASGWLLPDGWREDEPAWRRCLEHLPRLARATAAIGCRRAFTWLQPGSNQHGHERNLEFHRERLAPVAEVLSAHGCRLGLEFVGPLTSRRRLRFPFIDNLRDTLRLAGEIGSRTGVVLDSFHWFTSRGSVEEILALRAEQVIYVQLNDAPEGIPIELQLDERRCLPGATGVIDLVGFLRALEAIGYDGPVVPEPFGNGATWGADALRAVWKDAGIGDR